MSICTLTGDTKMLPKLWQTVQRLHVHIRSRICYGILMYKITMKFKSTHDIIIKLGGCIIMYTSMWNDVPEVHVHLSALDSDNMAENTTFEMAIVMNTCTIIHPVNCISYMYHTYKAHRFNPHPCHSPPMVEPCHPQLLPCPPPPMVHLALPLQLAWKWRWWNSHTASLLQIISTWCQPCFQQHIPSTQGWQMRMICWQAPSLLSACPVYGDPSLNTHSCEHNSHSHSTCTIYIVYYRRNCMTLCLLTQSMSAKFILVLNTPVEKWILFRR